MVEGIKSMLSLLDILEQALGSAKAKVTKTQAWNGGCGHSFTAQKREFWLGLRYSRPDSVAFEAYGVDKDRADKVGSGEVEKWGDGYRWRCWVNLASEEVHFFARPISDQIRYLENFVRKSIEAANNLFAD